MAPIENIEQFENWLKEQPQDVVAAVATRAALRVFPIAMRSDRYGARPYGSGPTSAGPTVVGPTGAKIKILALLTTRCILTSGIMAKTPTVEIRAAGQKTVVAAMTIGGAGTADDPTLVKAADAISAATSAAFDTQKTDVGLVVGIVTAFSAGGWSGPTPITRNFFGVACDAAYVDTELNIQELMTAPLWRGPNGPEWLAARLEKKAKHS